MKRLTGRTIVVNCPKCEADISDSYEPDDPSVGIVGGYYCDACDLGVADDGADRAPLEGDVPIAPTAAEQRSTPISQISGRPGHPGYEEFCRIARSWGYD